MNLERSGPTCVKVKTRHHLPSVTKITIGIIIADLEKWKLLNNLCLLTTLYPVRNP